MCCSKKTISMVSLDHCVIERRVTFCAACVHRAKSTSAATIAAAEAKPQPLPGLLLFVLPL